jgi:hypothetical protein
MDAHLIAQAFIGKEIRIRNPVFDSIQLFFYHVRDRLLSKTIKCWQCFIIVVGSDAFF